MQIAKECGNGIDFSLNFCPPRKDERRTLSVSRLKFVGSFQTVHLQDYIVKRSRVEREKEDGGSVNATTLEA